MAELQKQLDQVSRRMDRLYDDKLDESIDKETYGRKFAQFGTEKKELVKRIERQSDSDLSYLDTAPLMFDLSQRDVEIYRKGSPERRRLIFSHVLSGSPSGQPAGWGAQHTLPCQLPAKAVAETNRSKVTKLSENP